jgi:hypothetical protein
VSAQEDLVKELVRLRRGWGLQDRTIRARIGPQLIRLCGIEDSDNGRRVREKIQFWLRVVSAELPSALARAFLVAFALDRAHQHPKLTERVASLASEQSWGLRTARRRIDHATRLVAQAALERGAADVWPLALAAVLRLDAARRDEADAEVVVLRVPVPSDRFDLLIRFEAV